MAGFGRVGSIIGRFLQANGIQATYLDINPNNVDLLCKMGHRRYQAQRAVKTFRKHDEKYVRELAEMQHDKKLLIRSVKQRIGDLEKLMLTEMDNVGKDKDLGWDASTLIDEYGLKRRKIVVKDCKDNHELHEFLFMILCIYLYNNYFWIPACAGMTILENLRCLCVLCG